MWVRTLKITFKNQIMKDSIESYMSEKVDLTEGMILSYRVHLSSNAVLVNHFFSSKEASQGFTKNLNQFANKSLLREQRFMVTTVRSLNSK